ncbi:MAG TPA: redoxin domain-containing protein [Xanthomonadales bacterium]|nr:redoxin domain-containing protein [Xanthomonadales bacterium]
MSVRANRLKLLAILALFVIPLLLALMMFKGQMPLLSGETINQGKLIQPPVPLDWTAAIPANETHGTADLEGSWVILMPVPKACSQDCLKKVTGLRQVHRASGREQHRIRLALLSESEWDKASQEQFDGIYNQFMLLSDPSQELFDALQVAASHNQIHPEALATYLVDPLGNLMMAYDMADSETRMSKDLKRLLTWSKQDKG